MTTTPVDNALTDIYTYIDLYTHLIIIKGNVTLMKLQQNFLLHVILNIIHYKFNIRIS